VLPRLASLTLCRSIQLLALLTRGDATKDLELLVLRHQLTVPRRQVPRPRLEPADRALLAAVSRTMPRSRWSCFLVKPETLLRWHRLRGLDVGRPNTEDARAAIEDRPEHARRVWSRQAQPLDRAARRHECVALAVRKEAVVGDRREGAVPSDRLTPMVVAHRSPGCSPSLAPVLRCTLDSSNPTVAFPSLPFPSLPFPCASGSRWLATETIASSASAARVRACLGWRRRTLS
jgi:hypothetical protein